MSINLRRSIATVLSMALGSLAVSAIAQTAPNNTVAKSDELEEVVVTGSLIKHVASETAEPITIITAAQLQANGFTSVADALQHSIFATGSVQGPQFSGGFTQSAQTLSLFGLSPSYVKYLIDGLPMSDYPALYNGTDTIVSISGIPLSMVERIEILPGGQSSLYGSDAIAGVVHVIMKKKLDGVTVDARYGATRAGGGDERMLALSDSWSYNKLNILGGVQFEDRTPIWGFQRGLTSKVFSNGTSAATAGRDYLIYGKYGSDGYASNNYYFFDPNSCKGLAAEFGGTLQKYHRNNRGDYCGSLNSGYYTLAESDQESNIYLRGTYELNPKVEVYSDFLGSHEKSGYVSSLNAYVSSFDTNSTYAYFYDPNIDDLVNLQHVISPEEVGNLKNAFSYTNSDNLRFTLGVRGNLNDRWDYDLGGT